jgi:hypothetical protein
MMKDGKALTFGLGCVLTMVAAPSAVVQAAPVAGLSLAAAAVQSLAEPADPSVLLDLVHYRRHYHRHCTESFYHCFYGDSPRYFYPSYQYRLDSYTYHYPPFYW